MKHNQSLPLSHWGFTHWPFRATTAVQQFYPTAASSEALARIDYLVDTGRRLGVLLGEQGVGKSLILQTAARQLARQGRAVALVDGAATGPREFLWNIAASYGAAPSDDSDVPRLWRQIADSITQYRIQQVSTVLLADDAGQAGPDIMSQIVRLLRIDSSPAARWTVVLAAEPSQASRWNPALRELVDLRIDLSPWAPEDTVGYVQTSLVDAGRFEPLFDEAALARLHELAAGVPRRIAKLADYALLTGAAAGAHHIDEALVEAADDEIAWPEPAGVY